MLSTKSKRMPATRNTPSPDGVLMLAGPPPHLPVGIAMGLGRPGHAGAPQRANPPSSTVSRLGGICSRAPAKRQTRGPSTEVGFRLATRPLITAETMRAAASHGNADSSTQPVAIRHSEREGERERERGREREREREGEGEGERERERELVLTVFNVYLKTVKTFY